jgi:hypothetical protein
MQPGINLPADATIIQSLVFFTIALTEQPCIKSMIIHAQEKFIATAQGQVSGRRALWPPTSSGSYEKSWALKIQSQM